MTAVEILTAMAESDTLADEVLNYLDHGMRDEWDCSLRYGLDQGFGGIELRVAARSGLCLAKHHEASA